MIQDIGLHRFYNTYALRQPEENDFVYCFRGRDVLLGPEGRLPRYRELAELESIEYRYLFAIDQAHYFLALSQTPVELAGYVYQSSRTFRNVRPMDRALAGYTAMHLSSWYANNRFCGRCGGKMEVGQVERNMVCPHCGNLVYPRINPAVIVAVTDGDRLLMTKYSEKAHRVHHYVLIAGFVEIGETAEQTVEREVMEEVGLRVKDIRYFKSQPWGCDGNLTLAYFAKLDGGEGITLDREELADAHWFRREDVPVPKDDVSITSEMIHLFAAGREPKGV